MKLSRDVTQKLVFLFDECLPPLIRDSKTLMLPLMKLVFADKAETFMRFKERAGTLTSEEYAAIYRDTQKQHLQRNTDLNKGCIQKILASVRGATILDVGCGKAYLAHRLARTGHAVTAVDIVIEQDLPTRFPDIHFIEAFAERLPFENASFDTVICTKTLEHTLNIQATLQELRRVTRQRLIIVVPKQRPYRYTFDLHLHFFPYEHTLTAALGNSAHSVCETIGGDLFYSEDRTHGQLKNSR